MRLVYVDLARERGSDARAPTRIKQTNASADVLHDGTGTVHAASAA